MRTMSRLAKAHELIQRLGHAWADAACEKEAAEPGSQEFRDWAYVAQHLQLARVRLVTIERGRQA